LRFHNKRLSGWWKKKRASWTRANCTA
jgi:hypothetical protein